MKYTVKNLEEENNVNISKGDHLKRGLSLIFGLFGIIFALYIIISFLGTYFIGFISFEKEKELFGDLYSSNLIINSELTNKINNLINNQDENIEIIVIDDEQENAFAAPGGKILITNSLLEEMEYENEIIFIVGHEIGHIKNRDPLKRVFTQIPFKIILGILGSAVQFNYSEIGNLTTYGFDKNLEKKADIFGIKYVHELKGDVGCSLNFFEKNNSSLANFNEFFSDHPTTMSRIENLNDEILLLGYKDEICEKFNLSKY